MSGISFSVARGELFALLGTNGAGKTSTVELLEGLAPPTGGTVRVLGHDPYRERAAVRPRTGVMLQEGGFPSDLTVMETVRMWSACTTGARPAGEALEMVGLTGRGNVRVKQLSGGEKRRLDLALALTSRPEVLFLDEPTTGLDAEGRQETWELVRALRDNGTTVLLTTHYLEEAEALADRLAIMHQGRIVTTGTIAEVTARQPARIRFVLPEAVAGGAPPALPAGGGGRVPGRDPHPLPPGVAARTPGVGPGVRRTAARPRRPLRLPGGGVPRHREDPARAPGPGPAPDPRRRHPLRRHEEPEEHEEGDGMTTTTTPSATGRPPPPLRARRPLPGG